MPVLYGQTGISRRKLPIKGHNGLKHSVVITSINAPTVSVERLAKGATENNWELIIAGDTKTDDNNYQNRQDLTYLSFVDQKASGWKLAEMVPEKTYSRKMFGYLEAFSRNSDYVIDTDDDNWPLPDFFIPRNDLGFANASDQKCFSFAECGWVNIYQHFSPASNVWPRGYPLSRIKDALPLEAISHEACDSIIFQGLAEGAPDVDAVHRLVFPHHEYVFSTQAPIEIRNGAYCPFNSQNTTWQKTSFFLMYLPFTCSFRMTDIYRSYIAQRIVQEMGHGILFHHATMHQDRNVHSIISDFRDELMCYTDDGAYMTGLANLDLSGKSPAEMLLCCYEFSATEGYVKDDEMKGVLAWIDDLRSIGVL